MLVLSEFWGCCVLILDFLDFGFDSGVALVVGCLLVCVLILHLL